RLAALPGPAPPPLPDRAAARRGCPHARPPAVRPRPAVAGPGGPGPRRGGGAGRTRPRARLPGRRAVPRLREHRAASHGLAHPLALPTLAEGCAGRVPPEG